MYVYCYELAIKTTGIAFIMISITANLKSHLHLQDKFAYDAVMKNLVKETLTLLMTESKWCNFLCISIRQIALDKFEH